MSSEQDKQPQHLLHASCVALNPDRALLITGPSGSGKSTLALALMGFGGLLVADDQCLLSADLENGALFATCPEAISGKIEARGIGLLRAKHIETARVSACVDLSLEETDRLPPFREISMAGITLPVFHSVKGPGFAPGLWQWLKEGRWK